VTCAANILLGPWCESYFGSKDPQAVTIDEVAGYLLTVLIADRGRPLITVLVASFIAFRFFDIIKLPPARQAEKLPQGWGVLCDDLVSAIYAGLIVRWGMWLTGI
jgi:phosphatidylglycerophosphatase A